MVQVVSSESEAEVVGASTDKVEEEAPLVGGAMKSPLADFLAYVDATSVTVATTLMAIPSEVTPTTAEALMTAATTAGRPWMTRTILTRMTSRTRASIANPTCRGPPPRMRGNVEGRVQGMAEDVEGVEGI